MAPKNQRWWLTADSVEPKSRPAQTRGIGWSRISPHRGVEPGVRESHLGERHHHAGRGHDVRRDTTRWDRDAASATAVTAR